MTAASGAGSSRLPKTLIALDDARRAAIAKSQAAQERRNAASKEIGAGDGGEGRRRWPKP